MLACEASRQSDGSVFDAHHAQPVCAQHVLSDVYVRQSGRVQLPHVNTDGGRREEVL